MIDVDHEQLIGISGAARSIPGRPSDTTIWRWRSRGIAGVKLETICIGGRTYTSNEALDRFFERVTAAKAGERIPARSSRQRERQQRAAKGNLRAAGIIKD